MTKHSAKKRGRTFLAKNPFLIKEEIGENIALLLSRRKEALAVNDIKPPVKHDV
jgi:hypothetical protein